MRDVTNTPRYECVTIRRLSQDSQMKVKVPREILDSKETE